MSELDVQLKAIQAVAEKLEQIIYRYGTTHSINEIDRYSWQAHAASAQVLINAYNDAINNFNLPDNGVV